MKRVIIYIIFFLIPSYPLSGASETEQVLSKLGSLEDAISNLSLRILVLEKKIISLEEKVLLGATKKARKQPGDIRESQKSEYSDSDFSIQNITYETRYNNTIFRGTVANKSNNNYRYALFKIRVFNKKGATLSSNDFYILNIDKGTQRSFEATIHGVKTNEFEHYTIEFNKGS